MGNNQSAFLDRIRAAIKDTKDERTSWETFFHQAGDQPLLDAIAARGREVKLALLQELTLNAEALHLQVHTCASLHEAAVRIAGIARKSVPEFAASMEIILHDHPLLRALPLNNLLAEDNIPLRLTSAGDPEIRRHTRNASIGITVADWGIAESATIVQLTRTGRPRSTSLVPSIHIALLPIDDLVADLAEACALIRREGQLDSMVLISGPSKTADIEACMVLGAHGPKAMHLVVLTDDPAGNR
jgi:L-lactate dehydrogenase complex protein LldG